MLGDKEYNFAFTDNYTLEGCNTMATIGNNITGRENAIIPQA